MNIRQTLFVFGIVGILLSGCEKSEVKKQEKESKAISMKVKSAKAILSPTKGNSVKGQVTFTAVEGGVKIVANVEGLTPGSHGFHIHEFGDCTAPDGSSAGAHFNPTNKKHGGPDDKERHVGDLGNIIADAQGKAHYERIDKVISLDGKDRILGRSIIIHEKADDFKTQPAGDAGSRQACGVIVALP